MWLDDRHPAPLAPRPPPRAGTRVMNAAPTLSAHPASEEDFVALRRSPLFGRVSEAAIRELFKNQTALVAGKDARVLTWGEDAATCHIVLRGLVKLFRTSPSSETAVLAIHGPGRALMLAEGLTGKPCSASVEAVTPARLMTLDVARLKSQMESDPALSRALLMAASIDLRQLVAHIEELKAMTGPARLAAMIVKLSEAQGGARQVSLPYEKQLIASALGMTPESFSRAIGQLKAQGVKVARDKLDIADAGKLRDFAYFGR